MRGFLTLPKDRLIFGAATFGALMAPRFFEVGRLRIISFEPHAYYRLGSGKADQPSSP